MKKKWLSVMLGLAMVVSMTACGLQTPETPAAEAPKAEAPAAEAPAAEEPAAEEPAAEAPAAEPEVTLVYAEVNPLDTIVGQMATEFANKVAELSGGTMKIDIQASGVLGSENDVLDTMLGGGGTIDISRISAFALTSYGGEKSMLISIPPPFSWRHK